MPSPLVLPATTACSLIGAVAAVSTPGPLLPGTTTEAATGTLELICSAAVVPPSGERAT